MTWKRYGTDVVANYTVDNGLMLGILLTQKIHFFAAIIIYTSPNTVFILYEEEKLRIGKVGKNL